MQKLIIVSIFLIVSSIANAFETEAKYAILMDYDSKAILFEKESQTQMAPSSMSKMLTAYIAFEHLKSGQVKLEDMFPISEKAWKMEGTRMFIPLNAKVSFEDLLKGLIIQSGNDAAVAISEILMGSEEEFANTMNETAKKLGLTNSHFTNATGLPDTNNYSCAQDLAIIAYHSIKDFPEYYHYYSEKEFTYNGIKQGNRNGLLYKDIGADGLKTGHADDAGFGLTSSVKRKDRRLIAVVNGLPSNKVRTAEMEKLVNYGMMNFVKVQIAEKGQIIEQAQVANGNKSEVSLITDNEINFIIPKSEVKNIKTTIRYNTPLTAPIASGDQLGELIIESPSVHGVTYKLVAKEDVGKASFIQRIKNSINDIFK